MPARYREVTDRFFANLEKPVVSDGGQSEYDQQQRNKLGSMVIIMGTAMLLMTLMPNPV